MRIVFDDIMHPIQVLNAPAVSSVTYISGLEMKYFEGWANQKVTSRMMPEMR